MTAYAFVLLAIISSAAAAPWRCCKTQDGSTICFGDIGQPCVSPPSICIPPPCPPCTDSAVIYTPPPPCPPPSPPCPSPCPPPSPPPCSIPCYSPYN